MYQRKEKKRKILSQSRCVIFFSSSFFYFAGRKNAHYFSYPEQSFRASLRSRWEWLNAFSNRRFCFFFSLQRLVHLVHQSSFPGEKFAERSALAPYMFYEGRELTLLKTNGTHSHSAHSRGWENGVVCRCVCVRRTRKLPVCKCVCCQYLHSVCFSFVSVTLLAYALLTHLRALVLS